MKHVYLIFAAIVFGLISRFGIDKRAIGRPVDQYELARSTAGELAIIASLLLVAVSKEEKKP